MSNFAIIAHRGVPNILPENTIASFEQAIEMGADGVEMDIRLTKDHIPVLYHYYYLEQCTSLTGPIFNFTLDQLQNAKYTGKSPNGRNDYSISTLEETLERLGGRTSLEIEIKGPEPESAEIIGAVLNRRKDLWDSIEVTSYETMLLDKLKKVCPGITTDLLAKHSEPWMRPDVLAYSSIHRSRLAGARAVHLHHTQLTDDVVQKIRDAGIEVHSWDINTLEALKTIEYFEIPRFTTDNLQQALDYRKNQGRQP